ncbi:hypothetical protein ACFX11_020214 [Malus domestica]
MAWICSQCWEYEFFCSNIDKHGYKLGGMSVEFIVSRVQTQRWDMIVWPLHQPENFDKRWDSEVIVGIFSMYMVSV